MGYASSAARTWGARRSASEYTATEAIPSSRHARVIRSAISPRFATSTFLSKRLLPAASRHDRTAAAAASPVVPAAQDVAQDRPADGRAANVAQAAQRPALLVAAAEVGRGHDPVR